MVDAGFSLPVPPEDGSQSDSSNKNRQICLAVGQVSSIKNVKPEINLPYLFKFNCFPLGNKLLKGVHKIVCRTDCTGDCSADICSLYSKGGCQ